MYTLENRPKRLSLLRGVLLVLSLLGALFVLMAIAVLIEDAFPYANWLAYIAAIGLIVLVLYQFILGYKTSIIKDQLAIERVSGTRAKLVFSCRLAGIKFYGDPADAPEHDIKRRFLRKRSEYAIRALLVKQDGKKELVLLQVDEKLDALIRAARSGKKPQEAAEEE